MKCYILPAKGTVLAAFLALGGTASATTIEITVTNNQAVGGLAITPLYTALHNGSFDAFTLGDAASTGLGVIAETGFEGDIAAERRAVDPDSIGAVIGSPDGPPPIEPGETASRVLDVTANGPLFFTFLSMLLPSNDHFIGNDDPEAFQIFDANGGFLGDQTIRVTGEQIYDAGTEANGLTGSAFVAGQDISVSPAGEGIIQQGIPLAADLFGQTLASGAVLDGFIDFTADPGAFDLLTITIREVAPVPLPATAPLLLGALGYMTWRGRRRS